MPAIKHIEGLQDALASSEFMTYDLLEVAGTILINLEETRKYSAIDMSDYHTNLTIGLDDVEMKYEGTLEINADGVLSCSFDSRISTFGTATWGASDVNYILFVPTHSKVVAIINGGGTSTTVNASNIADGSVDNTEFQYLNGTTSTIQTQLTNKVEKNSTITGATKTKITYDSKGLITGGTDLLASDIPIKPLVINNQKGTAYTILVTDAGAYIRCDNASAITMTVPYLPIANFTYGTEIHIEQAYTGQVSLTASSGTTIKGEVKTAGQYKTITLTYVSPNTWVCKDGIV